MKTIYLDEKGNKIEYEDISSGSEWEPDGNDNRPSKDKKKKHSFFKTIIKTIAVLLVISFVVVSAVASASGYERSSLKRNKFVGYSDTERSPLVTNILLLGADGEDGGSQRSDSMMIVSLDYAHGKIKLTSLLRDSWLYIPNKDKYAKLNAAYSFGGPQYAKDTIEYNFGIHINHFLKVDFEMFKEIIDTLGGIEIEITPSEASFINKTTRYTVESGKDIHINGDVALVYSRIRKLDSDYMRTFRQRKVITAIISKAKTTNPVTLIQAIYKVLPLLESDLDYLELTSLAYKGGFASLFFDIQQLRLPTDDTMTIGYKGSQWVENPDIEACKKLLKEFVYSDYTEDK